MENKKFSFKFFNFYIKNTPKRMKNEWMILLCFSLSLSLISGLNYFFEAAQKYQFQESFWLFSDIDLVHYDLFNNEGAPIPHINYNYYFNHSDEEVEQILKTTNLDLQGYAPYAIFGINSAYVTIENYTSVIPSNCTSEFDFYHKINASSVNFGIFNDVFYNSPRFNTYFKIIEGRAPKNENEILVDYNFALKYNYHINQSSNVSIIIGNAFDSNPPVVDFLQEKIENITIVGTYLCTNDWFRIVDQRYTYSYTYEDYLNNKTYIFPEQLEHNLVFWYGNFKDLRNHPIQQWYFRVAQHKLYKAYLESGIIKSGYLLFYNRENIQFENLYFYRTSLTQKSRNLSIFLPFEVGLIDKLSYQLKITQENIRRSFLTIQILSIPVIVFSLLVSRNINDARGKKANEELILLKLRGLSVSQIQSQIFIGGVVNGVICTVLGSIIGYGTFYLYHRLLGDLFLNTSTIFLIPEITWNNFLYTLLLGILINAIALIPKIIMVGKIEYLDVSSSIQQVEELSLHYDEQVLFEGGDKKKTVDEILIEKYIQDYKKIEKTKSDNSIKLGEKRKRNFRIWKRKKKPEFVYENLFEMEKYSIKPITWLFIIVGIIPIILYSYLFIAFRFNVSDIVIDNRDKIVENIYYFHFFSLFFIGFFVTGLIRLFLIERPSRFARFAKRIAHIFAKRLDHIVSLEIIRKKKWARVTIYLAIFCTMLTITNFAFNSQYRYEIFDKKFLWGSDLNIEMINSNFHNQDEFQAFEDKLTTNFSSTYKFEIQTYSHIFVSNRSWMNISNLNISQIREIPIETFAIDPVDYLSVISSDNRPYIYPSYPQQIQKLLHNSDNISPLSEINVITTSQFLSFTGRKIGDLFNYSLLVYDSQTDQYVNQTFSLKIVDSLDYAPGMYQTDVYGLIAIIIDISSLQIPQTMWFASDVIELLDITPNSEIDLDEINIKFQPFITQYCEKAKYHAFDPNWNDIDVARYSLIIGSSGFYGLINLDFVLIGILLSIELSLTIIIMNRENEYFTNLLLFRGVGRNRVIFINILELFIVFLISGIIGCIIGYFYSWFICYVNLQILINNQPSNIPKEALFQIYGHWETIFVSYGVIFLIVLFINYFSQWLHYKRHEEYLNKEAL